MSDLDDALLAGPIDLDGTSRRPTYPSVVAETGVVLEERGSGREFVVVGMVNDVVRLRDAQGRNSKLKPRPGEFLVGGRGVTLVAPKVVAGAAGFTSSGSVAMDGVPARVARASRIFVEGKHDAELVERVWGDDLRIEGVVVQPMDGMDDLVEVVTTFGPRPQRRLGILLDHLIEGTKEWHAAQPVDHPDVLIRGHRFVDIWAAINPKAVGISAWPDVPKGQPWKEGVCAALGVTEPQRFWPEVLGSVASYADLDPSLVGAVEELIDFVAGADT